MKILVIKINDFEKVMLSMPLVRALKNKFPEAEIHYLTNVDYQNYLENTGFIQKVFVSQGDSTPLVLNLLKEGYAYIFDLEKNSKSAFVCYNLKQQFNSNVKVFSYPKYFIGKLLFNKKIQNHINLSSKYLQCAKSLQLQNDDLGLHYHLPENEKLKENDLPHAHLGGFVAINIFKCQETEKNNLMLMAQKISFPIVLIGQQKESALAEDIKNIDPIRIYNACGKFSEVETFDILRRSKIVLSKNNRLAYLAVAAKKPIINYSPKSLQVNDVFPYTNNNAQYIYQKNNINNTHSVIEMAQNWLKTK